MIDYNMNVIREWVEVGGVLGYDTNRNGVFTLYIMDDGEFHDRFEGEGGADVTEDELARKFCESALRHAGICEEEIWQLMDWGTDEIMEVMEG